MAKSTAVLVLGPMRAGKSTAASYLAEEHGFRRYSLADKLKQLHHTVTGNFEKDREWLQTVGASCRAVFGESFWCDRLIEQLKKEKPDCFVVDDVRYENELTSLYKFARSYYKRVIVLLISVPMDVQIQRGAEISTLSHESEKYSTTLLNSAIYNEAGVGSVTLYGALRIPVMDGTIPIEDYHRELEAELRFDEFEKLSRVYTGIAEVDDVIHITGLVDLPEE